MEGMPLRVEPTSAEQGRIARAAGLLEDLLRTPPRWLVWAVWVAAVVAVAVSCVGWLSTLTYPGTPWQTSQSMIDFRETIWAPGRYLLNGGNPYDHDAYLLANPGSQEFDPYAPAWFLLAVPVGALPFAVSAAVYLAVGAVVAVVLLRTVAAWGAPGLVRIGVPALLLYLCAWAPGKYGLQNGGALLVALGWVLVVRDVVEHAPAVPQRRPDERPARMWGVVPSGAWAAGVGLALSLLKPQFGLPLVVIALVAGRWAVVWRGAVALLAGSIPVVIACSVNAGGFDRFLISILQLVGYASSPSAQTGLSSSENRRADLLGMLARLTGEAPTAWLQLVVPLVVLALGVLVVRRAREPLTIAAGVAAATLLPVVHQSYDNIILLMPVVVTIDVVLARRRIGRLDLLVGLIGLIPMLKVHQLSQIVAPGSGNAGAELPATAAIAVTLVLGAVAAVTAQQPDMPVAGPTLSRSTS